MKVNKETENAGIGKGMNYKFMIMGSFYSKSKWLLVLLVLTCFNSCNKIDKLNGTTWEATEISNINQFEIIRIGEDGGEIKEYFFDDKMTISFIEQTVSINYKITEIGYENNSSYTYTKEKQKILFTETIGFDAPRKWECSVYKNKLKVEIRWASGYKWTTNFRKL